MLRDSGFGHDQRVGTAFCELCFQSALSTLATNPRHHERVPSYTQVHNCSTTFQASLCLGWVTQKPRESQCGDSLQCARNHRRFAQVLDGATSHSRCVPHAAFLVPLHLLP